MLRQNLWKLLLTAAIVIWSVAELTPLKDRKFDQYIKSEATAKPTEFAALMKDASDRVASGRAQSVFVALKQIGKEQKLDLSQFFPEIRLEATLKNVDRRNNILLDELLKRSKGRLQLGLDLKGGVAFTLEVAERSGAATSTRDSEQKLNKAIEIISTRINSLGVAEPIVRPVGNNRIEVQLPGVSTRDNPEIISSLKKPARLDFRRVYSGGTPETIPANEAPPGYEAMTLEQESRNGEIRTSELYIKRIPEMTGNALSEAYASMDEFGRFKILLRFTKEGAKQFATVTREIADERKTHRSSGPAGHRARWQTLFGPVRARRDPERQRRDHRHIHAARGHRTRQRAEQSARPARWTSRSSTRSARRWHRTRSTAA